MMKQIATILLIAGCTFSAFADKVPSELRNLQAIRVKKIKEIDDAYAKALEKLKVKYTKRGDLESANAIQAEISQFEMSAENTPQTNPTDSLQINTKRPAKVYSKADFIRFKDGAQVRDGSPAKFSDIPAKYKGWKSAHLPNEATQRHYTFKVKEAGDVYIVFQHKMDDEGWTVVDKVLIDWTDKKVSQYILKKHFDKGAEHEFDKKHFSRGHGIRLLSPD